jgi:hypothetical protein
VTPSVFSLGFLVVSERSVHAEDDMRPGRQ